MAAALVSQQATPENQAVSAAPAASSANSEQNRQALRLLAYVHLRNIHNSTGAGRVARQMVEHLAMRPHVDLRILADANDHARIVPAVGAPWDRFHYSLFTADTSRQQARWFFLDRPRAQRFWPEAEVVYCTGEAYVPAGKARLAVTLHDAAYFERDAHQADATFRRQRFKWQLLYGKLNHKADLFHVVSQFSADRISHFFPQLAGRIRVVHNAVTPHFFAPVSAEGLAYLASHGLSSRPYVLIPGGLHYRKNAELILAAWPSLQRLFPDLTLVVVNHSNPVYAERFQALGGNSFLAGFVSDDALKALYTKAAVVWFPSRYEGFGLPVVEAMACGAPVVTSRSSSLPEIGGDAVVYAEANTKEAHLSALEALLRSDSLRSEYASRGRQRATLFDWKRAAAEMQRHLTSLR